MYIDVVYSDEKAITSDNNTNYVLKIISFIRNVMIVMWKRERGREREEETGDCYD